MTKMQSRETTHEILPDDQPFLALRRPFLVGAEEGLDGLFDLGSRLVGWKTETGESPEWEKHGSVLDGSGTYELTWHHPDRPELREWLSSRDVGNLPLASLLSFLGLPEAGDLSGFVTVLDMRLGQVDQLVYGSRDGGLVTVAFDHSDGVCSLFAAQVDPLQFDELINGMSHEFHVGLGMSEEDIPTPEEIFARAESQAAQSDDPFAGIPVPPRSQMH